MLSEEKINTNYIKWIEKLQKYSCYSEEMINDIGNNIKTASFSINETSGCAYSGSMIDVVLNKLCTIAFSINEFGYKYSQNLKVNPQMLMRVLLLQHISKCELFIPQTQQWKLKNGFPFEFNPDLNAKLKCGERSLYLCNRYGIKFSEDEFEAMTIIDKQDEKFDFFITPLSALVKSVNQMAQIDLRIEYNKNKQINTIEK